MCVCVDQHTPWRVCVVGPLDFGFNLLIYGLPLRQKAQLLAKAHYDISTTPCQPYQFPLPPSTTLHLFRALSTSQIAKKLNQPHLHAARRMCPKSLMSQKLRGQIFSGFNALLPPWSPRPPPAQKVRERWLATKVCANTLQICKNIMMIMSFCLPSGKKAKRKLAVKKLKYWQM